MKRLYLFALLAFAPAVSGQEIDLTDEREAPAPAPPAVVGRNLVSLEVKFMTHETDAAAAKNTVDVLDERTLAAMRPNLKQISAPRLMTFDKQDVTVSVTNQHAYVRSRDKAGKAVNDVVASGTVLEGRPTIKGKKVEFAFTLTRSELSDPIAKLQTPRGDIEMPLVTRDEIIATLEIADGAELALRLRTRGRKQVAILLIRATIVRAAPVKKPK